MNRGQADAVGSIISVISMAILALLGIHLFAQLDQNITINGPLAGTSHKVLADGADALAMAVGGTSLAVTAILILRARA